MPVTVHSPGTGSGSLTVTRPGDPALTPTSVNVFGNDGASMVRMPLTLHADGTLVGLWDLTLGTR